MKRKTLRERANEAAARWRDRGCANVDEFIAYKLGFLAGHRAAKRRGGYVLVPREPTPEIIEAGRKAVYEYGTRLGDTYGIDSGSICAVQAYRAMLAAATSEKL